MAADAATATVARIRWTRPSARTSTALRALLDDPGIAVEHLQKLIPTVDAAGARDFYDRYVAPYFRVHGRADPEVVARALPAVAAELRASGGLDDVHVPAYEEVYIPPPEADYRRMR